MNSLSIKSLTYARWACFLFGLSIIFLGILELCQGFSLGSFSIPPRWRPETITFPFALKLECWFFVFFGVFLLVPVEKIKSDQTWKIVFSLICLASIIFAFAMISEVMAKNYIAAAAKTKARMPVFQAVLLFLSLGQIPIHLFIRKPELLD